MDSRDAFQRENLDAFRQQDSKGRRVCAMITFALGIALMMPIGLLLDDSLNEDSRRIILTTQLVTMGLFAIGLGLLWRLDFGIHVSTVGVALVLIAAFALGLMMSVNPKAAMGYYIGLILAMGFTLLLGVNGLQATLCATVILLIYGIAFFFNQLPVTVEKANTPFLAALFISVTVLWVITSHFSYRSRFANFLLSRRLDQSDQLREDNKHLKQLDTQRMEFLENISHELRTPLSMVLAPLDQLLMPRSGFSGDLTVQLGRVRRNAERLRLLVDDLLDVVRLDHKAFRLQLDDVDARKFLRKLIEDVRPTAQQQGLELRLHSVSLPVNLQADVERLERVLLNLINNAIKFSPQGGRVDVYLNSKEGMAVFEVIDQGPGIPESERDRIFDRMFQSDSTDVISFKGLGLGLAIASDIVQWHGGTIAVSGGPDGGSQFTVSIPTTSPTNQDMLHESISIPPPLEQIERGIAEPIKTNSQPDNNSTEVEPIEILVVDDEPDLRRFLRDSLRGEFNTITAASAAEGLKTAARRRPRCILLDLMLPDGDGLSVLRQLRKNPELHDTKVIILTAHFDENVKIQALRLGADDFLSKPFGITEVRARLASLIRSSQLQTDLRREQKELRRSLRQLKETQSQLFQSEKMRAVASLAAGLLHEINNPISYTQMAVSTLKQDLEKGHDIMETISDIQDGVQRISDIVTDLRTFAYPQQDGVLKSFELKDAVSTAKRFAAHECDGIRIETQSDQYAGAEVRGSQSQVTQVLLNLILNAVTALRKMPTLNNPTVRILAEYRPQSVLIKVQDNGPGIPDSIRRRVMDPFFTTSDPGKGLGLGLSICHTIIKNHGGNLVLDDDDSGGTAFAFDLPLIIDE